MKWFLVVLTVFSLSSCTKEDFALLAERVTNSERQGAVLPTSSVQVGVFIPEGLLKIPLDTIRLDMGNSYNVRFFSREDTLNFAKTHDLSFQWEGKSLRVNAIPFIKDTIPMLFANYFPHQEYWLKIISYNINTDKISVVDGGDLVYLNNNGVKWWKFETDGETSSKRFRLAVSP